jgi:hypothetical protein
LFPPAALSRAIKKGLVNERIELFPNYLIYLLFYFFPQL